MNILKGADKLKDIQRYVYFLKVYMNTHCKYLCILKFKR